MGWWWLRNPAAVDMVYKYPIIYRVLIHSGAGFLPSTVYLTATTCPFWVFVVFWILFWENVYIYIYVLHGKSLNSCPQKQFQFFCFATGFPSLQNLLQSLHLQNIKGLEGLETILRSFLNLQHLTHDVASWFASHQNVINMRQSCSIWHGFCSTSSSIFSWCCFMDLHHPSSILRQVWSDRDLCAVSSYQIYTKGPQNLHV